MQHSGDRVRITVRLIHGGSDKHIWANSYERDLRDVLALEGDLTQEVADQIHANLTAQNQMPPVQPRPVNLNALEAYLQGNYYLDKAEALMDPRDEGLRRAGQYFQQAIDSQPDFAPAYIGLARAHHNLLWPSREDFAIMRGAGAKAVELDTTSSDARETAALTKFEDWDWVAPRRNTARLSGSTPIMPQHTATWPTVLMPWDA